GLPSGLRGRSLFLLLVVVGLSRRFAKHGTKVIIGLRLLGDELGVACLERRLQSRTIHVVVLITLRGLFLVIIVTRVDVVEVVQVVGGLAVHVLVIILDIRSLQIAIGELGCREDPGDLGLLLALVLRVLDGDAN